MSWNEKGFRRQVTNGRASEADRSKAVQGRRDAEATGGTQWRCDLGDFYILDLNSNTLVAQFDRRGPEEHRTGTMIVLPYPPAGACVAGKTPRPIAEDSALVASSERSRAAGWPRGRSA